MKNRKKMFLTLVIATIVSFTSCEKQKDEPAPAPTITATEVKNLGTFTVNGTVQTPTSFVWKKVPFNNPTFTQVVVSNEKFDLRLDFPTTNVESGEYVITQDPMVAKRVKINLFDNSRASSMTTDGAFVTKVIVDGTKITFSEIVIRENPNTKVSANFTVKP